MPPSFLPSFSGNLDELHLDRFSNAINVQNILYVHGSSAGMSRLNSGHFGRRATDSRRYRVDGDSGGLAMPSQLDSEPPPANGGTPLLIHEFSLSVDHLIVQENADKTNNHGRLTCNLHRQHSWCNLFPMARVT